MFNRESRRRYFGRLIQQSENGKDRSKSKSKQKPKRRKK